MSTLKVDTYLTRGGASEIAIDKLKGVTAAGSMLVVGEGGTVTTNVQQGLAKAWCNWNGTGTAAIGDSLNTTSLTDNATGNYTITIANDMAATTYVCTYENNPDDANIGLGGWLLGTFCASGSSNIPKIKTATAIRVNANDMQGTSRDPAQPGIIFHGDLA